MAPLFVGSNSDDSRIRSDRVGLAASTSNPASADTGDVYYNSTDNKLTLYNGSAWSALGGGGASVELTVSGSISDGQPVIINTDGTVGIITMLPSDTPSIGSAVVFESAAVYRPSATFDSSNNKVVIAYRDQGNSNYGTAIVGTVSGSSISFGSPVIFEYDDTQDISATFDSTNNKVVISYRDNGNSSNGTAIVGTVSGTSISFGSATVFETDSTSYVSSAYDSSNGKVVVAYRDEGNSNYGKAIVGTVSGTSISFGSAVTFESATTSAISVTFDSSNNKIVISYCDEGNSEYGTAIVGTVSGTSISFGTAVVFESAASIRTSATFDSTNNKVVIAYKDQGAGNRGTAIVGTVSGTSISFGSASVYETGNTDNMSVVYDSTNQRVVIAYVDKNDSDQGKLVVGTVTGTAVTFGSPVTHETGETELHSAAFDSSNDKVVIAYEDITNSQYGTAIVASTTSTNLTSTNFLGFSDAAYTNGQTAKIQIEGSVDDAQTGLTTARKFYVQGDGTLGISTDDPVVPAGTAISATKIIIET